MTRGEQVGLGLGLVGMSFLVFAGRNVAGGDLLFGGIYGLIAGGLLLAAWAGPRLAGLEGRQTLAWGLGLGAVGMTLRVIDYFLGPPGFSGFTVAFFLWFGGLALATWAASRWMGPASPAGLAGLLGVRAGLGVLAAAFALYLVLVALDPDRAPELLAAHGMGLAGSLLAVLALPSASPGVAGAPTSSG